MIEASFPELFLNQVVHGLHFIVLMLPVWILQELLHHFNFREFILTALSTTFFYFLSDVAHRDIKSWRVSLQLVANAKVDNYCFPNTFSRDDVVSEPWRPTSTTTSRPPTTC